ncbi:MAG: hypothetical protein JWM58_2281 [Rhizobium sp.]|nr:hypothetical protein [Rhizobium sp.]
MNQQTMPNITLFDLLARNWRRPAAVSHLCFNDDDTLLAISATDGSVALARLADNEPPESRIAIDNGQTTIQPRQGRPSPTINTRIQEGGKLSAHLDGEFLVLTGSGELIRVNRTGQIVVKVLADKSPITAFDHCSTRGRTVAVVHHQLRLQSAGSGPIQEVDLGEHAVEIVSVSADGSLIALAGADGISIRSTAGDLVQIRHIQLPARPLSLKWGADGKWLACGLETGGLCLVELANGRDVMLSDFPGPVGSLGWSAPANAFFTSGAFRIAGWSMDTPPLSNNATGALATGHPGFVMVEAVAAHPVRRLVAAGYANGKIVVARIGSPEELVVRDAGGPVTALQWTADGRHLAVGDAHGNAAIVTFPNQIFK